MATFTRIKLEEIDVPGARFSKEDITSHSVCELKRWLECRRLSTSGKKTELIQRCLDCINAGKASEIVITVDGGKWFEMKVLQQNSTSVTTDGIVKTKVQPPIVPIIGWKDFPSVAIPNGFSYGTIYSHLISTSRLQTCSDDEGDSDDDYHTSKPLKKSRQFFLSGHVKNLKDCEKDTFYFIKATVMASYKQGVEYNVTVTILSTGAVADASCDCKAHGKMNVWGLNPVPETLAIVYGRNHESDAFDAYSKQLDPPFAAVNTGFWVNPDYPELGCSPDGLIYHNSKLVGVLEIKCPLVIEKFHPNDAIEKLAKKQLQNFCCVTANGVSQLEKSHKCFYQCQMQMAICDVEYCDFVMWSPNGISVERLARDRVFWSDIVDKLKHFYYNSMLPEIFEMRTPRRLLPFKL
ncbi:hypothetical protein ScPMuIL_002894 [Solemya velum]